MTPIQIQQMFERLQAQNPQPTTGLKHQTPFQLLSAPSIARVRITGEL